MTCHYDGVEGRLANHSAGSLLDEALELVRHSPQLYLAGLPGALLLGVTFAVFVLFHRGAWLVVPADEMLFARTVPASLAVALALGLRGVGHGVVARRLALALGRAPRRWRPLALFGAALLVPALTLPAAVLLLFPALFVGGRLAPLPALIAGEGSPLPEAVAACWTRPRGDAWLGSAVTLVTTLLGVLLVVNLLLGSWLGVHALRMLTGADTTVLSRVASPFNEGFLLGVVVLAAVLMDPVFAVARALLALRMTAGPTVEGLERRWRQHLARPGPLPSAIVLLLTLTFASPLGAHAEVRSLHDWVSGAEQIAESLQGLADEWEGAETVLLELERPWMDQSLSGKVRLPSGGLLELHGEALLGGLPERIDSMWSADLVRAKAVQIELASVEAALLLTVSPSSGLSSERALAEELSGGRYRLRDEMDGASRVRRPGLREKIVSWWNALWDEQDAPVVGGPVAPPGTSSRMIVGLVAVTVSLAVIAMLVLLLRAVSWPRRAPLRSGSTGLSKGVDPRSRTSRNWLVEAEFAADCGRYEEAIRNLYLGVLAYQDSVGAIEARPGRSNGEYVSSFRGEQAARARFARATLQFDQLRYGGTPSSPERWSSMRSECAPLLSSPGSRGDSS